MTESWPASGDLTDEEKLRVAYGDLLGAVRSVRERVGSLIFAKRLVDRWRLFTAEGVAMCRTEPVEGDAP